MIRGDIREGRVFHKLRRICYNKYVVDSYTFRHCEGTLVVFFVYIRKKYLTKIAEGVIIIVTLKKGDAFMSKKEPDKSKLEVLKKHGALNPRPEGVKDPLFLEEEFFDPHDLVQAKYEMLRRVQKDGQSVSHASANFGFSRLSFYRIQSAFDRGGLVGIIPQRRGPKRAHKLSNEVMDFIEESIEKDKSLRARKLKDLVEEHFRITIHPRSIERALSRRKKNGRRN